MAVVINQSALIGDQSKLFAACALTVKAQLGAIRDYAERDGPWGRKESRVKIRRIIMTNRTLQHIRDIAIRYWALHLDARTMPDTNSKEKAFRIGQAMLMMDVCRDQMDQALSYFDDVTPEEIGIVGGSDERLIRLGRVYHRRWAGAAFDNEAAFYKKYKDAAYAALLQGRPATRQGKTVGFERPTPPVEDAFPRFGDLKGIMQPIHGERERNGLESPGEDPMSIMSKDRLTTPFDGLRTRTSVQPWTPGAGLRAEPPVQQLTPPLSIATTSRKRPGPEEASTTSPKRKSPVEKGADSVGRGRSKSPTKRSPMKKGAEPGIDRNDRLKTPSEELKASGFVTPTSAIPKGTRRPPIHRLQPVKEEGSDRPGLRRPKLDQGSKLVKEENEKPFGSGNVPKFVSSIKSGVKKDAEINGPQVGGSLQLRLEERERKKQAREAVGGGAPGDSGSESSDDEDHAMRVSDDRMSDAARKFQTALKKLKEFAKANQFPKAATLPRYNQLFAEMTPALYAAWPAADLAYRGEIPAGAGEKMGFVNDEYARGVAIMVQTTIDYVDGVSTVGNGGLEWLRRNPMTRNLETHATHMPIPDYGA